MHFQDWNTHCHKSQSNHSGKFFFFRLKNMADLYISHILNFWMNSVNTTLLFHSSQPSSLMLHVIHCTRWLDYLLHKGFCKAKNFHMTKKMSQSLVNSIDTVFVCPCDFVHNFTGVIVLDFPSEWKSCGHSRVNCIIAAEQPQIDYTCCLRNRRLCETPVIPRKHTYANT